MSKNSDLARQAFAKEIEEAQRKAERADRGNITGWQNHLAQLRHADLRRDVEQRV